MWAKTNKLQCHFSYSLTLDKNDPSTLLTLSLAAISLGFKLGPLETWTASQAYSNPKQFWASPLSTAEIESMVVACMMAANS